MQPAPSPSTELPSRVDVLEKAVRSLGGGLPPKVTRFIKRRVIAERRQILNQKLGGASMAVYRAFEREFGLNGQDPDPIFERGTHQQIEAEVLEFLGMTKSRGPVENRIAFQNDSWDLPSPVHEQIFCQAIVKVFASKGIRVTMVPTENPQLKVVRFIEGPAQVPQQPHPAEDQTK